MMIGDGDLRARRRPGREGRPLRQLVLAFALLMILLRPGASAAQPSDEAVLRDRLDALLSTSLVDDGFWGVAVLDVESGELLYEHHAQKHFVPASNAKLYTTAAALDQLGSDFRFRTVLYARGTVEDGVLRGDLLLRGSGDPTLGGHYDLLTGEWNEHVDETVLFRAWADSLKAAGIRVVEGNVVGDDDVTDDMPLGVGWSWDDEPYYYAAQVSGLSFGDNVVRLRVAGGSNAGDPARVTWAPLQTDYVDVVNRSSTTTRGGAVEEGYRRERGTNRIVVTTRVPAGATELERVSIENPTRYAAYTLAAVLEREGIEVRGGAVDVDDLPSKPSYQGRLVRRVASHASPPLSSITRVVNKTSVNLYAELLLKALGAYRPPPGWTPGSSRAGVAALTRTLLRAGIDTMQVHLVDGSGLSRMNLVTPEATVRLLRYMALHDDGYVRQAFHNSLPVAGVDGTLRSRMRSGPAYRNARAKTGTLTYASGLSGYVETRSGRRLAFSIIGNHYTAPSSAARRLQDEIVERLAASAL